MEACHSTLFFSLCVPTWNPTSLLALVILNPSYGIRMELWYRKHQRGCNVFYVEPGCHDQWARMKWKKERKNLSGKIMPKQKITLLWNIAKRKLNLWKKNTWFISRCLTTYQIKEIDFILVLDLVISSITVSETCMRKDSGIKNSYLVDLAPFRVLLVTHNW